MTHKKMHLTLNARHGGYITYWRLIGRSFEKFEQAIALYSLPKQMFVWTTLIPMYIYWALIKPLIWVFSTKTIYRIFLENGEMTYFYRVKILQLFRIPFFAYPTHKPTNADMEYLKDKF